MNIHEYQAKSIMAAAGLRTPAGEVVHSVEEAVAAAKKLGGDIWVVKAQIHAGGRGKAGGVKLARNLQDVEKHAEESWERCWSPIKPARRERPSTLS